MKPATAFVNALNFSWIRKYGGDNLDYGKSLVKCTDDGFAIIGSTKSFGAGNLDVWLIRTDDSGNLLWNKTYGGIDDDCGYALVECSDRGFALVGYTSSYGEGSSDFWLIRTDSYGNHLWNFTFGGDNEETGWALVECDDGGFAIVGYTESFGNNPPYKDVLVVRTNATGWHLWNCTYGGISQDWGFSIVRNNDGFILGANTISFGSDSEWDIWLIQINSFGIPLWNQTIGQRNRSETGHSMVYSSDGGFTFVGHSISWNDPDPSFQLYYLHTDLSGNQVWNHTYSGCCGNSIIECSDDGFAIAGIYQSEVQVVRVDGNGNPLWSYYYGVDSYLHEGNAIIEHNDGFVITGMTDNNLLATDSSGDLLLLWIPDESPIIWSILPAIQSAGIWIVSGIIIVGTIIIIFILIKSRKMTSDAQ